MRSPAPAYSHRVRGPRAGGTPLDFSFALRRWRCTTWTVTAQPVVRFSKSRTMERTSSSCSSTAMDRWWAGSTSTTLGIALPRSATGSPNGSQEHQRRQSRAILVNATRARSGRRGDHHRHASLEICCVVARQIRRGQMRIPPHFHEPTTGRGRVPGLVGQCSIIGLMSTYMSGYDVRRRRRGDLGSHQNGTRAFNIVLGARP